MMVLKRYIRRLNKKITRLLIAFIFLFQAINGFSRPFPKSGHLSDSSENVYISIVPSKNSVYVGEAFTINYFLYHSIPVVDPGNRPEFNFKNAYFEEFPYQEKTDDETIDSRGYHTVLIKKLLVIPRNTGPFIIPAVSIKIKVDAPPDKNDFFEQDKYISKIVSSQAKIINVLPLPVTADSLSFSGAVGRFVVADGFIKDKKSDNVLKVSLTITGSGDLKFTRLSPFQFPWGINMYNENNSATHTVSSNGLNSKIVYSFNLVANYRGEYNLGPLCFMYFDPESLKYVKFSPKSYKWTVTSGSAMPQVSHNLNSTAYTNSEALLMVPALLNETDENEYFFNSTYCRALMIFACLIFAFGSMYSHYLKTRDINQLFYSYKKAKHQALKSIKNLESTSADADMFSKNLMLIFNKYLLDRNFIQNKDFSADNIITSLKKHNVPESIGQKVVAFLKEHQHIRFSVKKNITGGVSQYCLMLVQIIENIDNYTHA